MTEYSWDRWIKNPSSIEFIESYPAEIYEYYDPTKKDFSKYVLNKVYPATIFDMDSAILNDHSENKTLLESILIEPLYHNGIIETAMPIEDFKDFPYNIGDYIGDSIRSKFEIVIYKENGFKKIETWPLRIFYDEEFKQKLHKKKIDSINNDEFFKNFVRKEFLILLKNREDSLKKE